MNKTIRFTTFALLLIIFIFTFEYLFLGQLSFVRGLDNLDWALPRQYLIVNLLKLGQFQEWVPEIGGGIYAPQFDGRPYNLLSLFFLLPYQWAYKAIVLFGFTCATFGWYLLNNRLFKLKGYSFYISLLWYLLFLANFDVLPAFLAYGLFPILFYRLAIFVETKLSFISALELCLLVCVYTFSTTVAAFTLYHLVGLAVLSYLFLGKDLKKAALTVGFFSVCVILIKLPELISLKQAAQQSSRVLGQGYYQADIRGTLLKFYATLRENWLVYAMMLIAHLLKNTSHLKKVFFWFLLLTFGPNLYYLALPLLKIGFGTLAEFPLDRFNLNSIFLGAFILGATLDSIEPGNTLKINRRGIFQLKGILGGIALLVLGLSVAQVKAAHIYSAMIENTNFRWTESSHLLELKRIIASSKKMARVMPIEDKYGSFLPGTLVFSGLETFGGEINLPSLRFTNYWKKMVPIGQYSHSFSLGRIDDRSAIAQNHLLKSIRWQMLGLANVKYIVSPYPLTDFIELGSINSPEPTDCPLEGALLTRILCKIGNTKTGNALYLYENKLAFERYRLVRNAKLFENEAALLEAISVATLPELLSTVYLERNKISPTGPNDLSNNPPTPQITNNESADLLSVSFNKTSIQEFEVSCKAKCFFIAQTTYSPFWHAYSNNKEIEILPAYYNFMAVALDSGSTTLQLRFEPNRKLTD